MTYFLEVGLVLILVPWSTFWDRNFFAEMLPLVGQFVRNNYVRGAVTGLGLVNLYVGFVELASLFLRRRSRPPRSQAKLTTDYR